MDVAGLEDEEGLFVQGRRHFSGCNGANIVN